MLLLSSGAPVPVGSAGGTGPPDPPPLPICPACRNTLNLLTPFYMQSLGLDLEDLIDEAQHFVD